MSLDVCSDASASAVVLVSLAACSGESWLFDRVFDSIIRICFH